MANTSPQNASLSAIWAQLTENQRRFVVAMQTAPNKRAAAEAIGVAPATTYKWSRIVDDAIRLIGEDVTQSALEMLKGSLAEAALGKVLEMQSKDERVASAARTEILDRGLGKPTQRQEVKHEGELNVESDTLQAALDALTKRAAGL